MAFFQELQKQRVIQPALACVLEHWFCNSQDGGPVVPFNERRFIWASNWHSFVENNPRPFRTAVHQLASGAVPWDPALLILGAALYPRAPGLLEQIVFSIRTNHGLDPANPALERALGATYASVFYLDAVEEVMAVLAEQVLQADSIPLLVQGARDVLSIAADVRRGGKCHRCARAGEAPAMTGWMPHWPEKKQP